MINETINTGGTIRIGCKIIALIKTQRNTSMYTIIKHGEENTVDILLREFPLAPPAGLRGDHRHLMTTIKMKNPTCPILLGGDLIEEIL